jgi:multidrug efflux pump subunit AcrA (membrane-fusion protein)
MKSQLARIVIPIVILVAGVAAFFALGKKAKEKTQLAQGPTVPEVEVLAVGRHDGRLDIGIDGEVVPFQEITLSAQVAGQIVYKAEVARAGQFTEEGADLFRIDECDYSLAVRRLENQLEQAGSSVREIDEEIAGTQRLVDLAEDQVGLSQNDCDREVKLHGRGASSDFELDQARRDLVGAKNALTTVRNQLKLAQTRRNRLVQAQQLTALQKEKAEHDLARATITAPLDGVIVKDFVEEGDYVHVGAPLVTIEDTSAVEVKCNLRMDELYWVWSQETTGAVDEEIDEINCDYEIPSTPVTIVYRLQHRDFMWEGQLWRIDGVGLDERTRTVPCRVIVRKPQDVWILEGDKRCRATGGPPALVRGMYVDVVVHVTPTARLLRVPQRAVRPGGEVWVTRPVAAGEPPDGSKESGSGVHRVDVVDVDVVEIAGNDAVVSVEAGELATGDLVVVSPLGISVRGSSDDREAALENILVAVKRDHGTFAYSVSMK